MESSFHGGFQGSFITFRQAWVTKWSGDSEGNRASGTVLTPNLALPYIISQSWAWPGATFANMWPLGEIETGRLDVYWVYLTLTEDYPAQAQLSSKRSIAPLTVTPSLDSWLLLAARGPLGRVARGGVFLALLPAHCGREPHCCPVSRALCVRPGLPGASFQDIPEPGSHPQEGIIILACDTNKFSNQVQ